MNLSTQSEVIRGSSPLLCENDTPVVLHTRVVTGTGGGPDKTILNSSRFLQSAGYRTLCAYMHPPGDNGFGEIKRKADKWDAPLYAVEDRGPWDWKVISQFVQICRDERVAIWHGHDYKSNALGLLMQRFWPMRLVTTVHGWVKQTARTPLYYCLDRLCLRRYEKVICVSQDLYEAVRASGVPPSRCALIENAIDTQDFKRRHTTQQAKSLAGIPPDRLVVGAIGRLSAEKGYDLLIRAVDRLLHNNLNIELIVIGEGDEKAQLEQLIARLGRGDRIRLLGYQADVKPSYECMDVFASSSLREGLPNVLLEALALEVPVLATRIAGVPRLITDKVNGLLVEPGSVNELTDKLGYMLQNTEIRQEFQQRGRDIVEKLYSFEVRMQKIRAIYDELLGRNGFALAR